MLKFVKEKFLLDPTQVDGNGNDQAASSAGTQTNNDNASVDTVDSAADIQAAKNAAESSGIPKQPVSGKGKAPIATDKTGVIDFDEMDDDNIVREPLIKKDKKAPVTKVADEGVEQVTTDLETKENKELVAKEKVEQGKRDYSIFSEADAALMKKQPNGVYDTFKNRLAQAKVVEGDLNKLKTEVIPNLEKGIVKLPESYIENPKAYVLSPEYSKFRANHANASEEEQHWLQQLANVEDGKPWQDIKGRDKDGNIVLEEASEDYSGATKVAIQDALNKARQYKGHFESKIIALRDSHAGSYKKAVEAIDADCAKHFPWVSDEKILAAPIEYEDPETKKLVSAPIKDVLQHAINMVNPAFRNHPLTRVFANLIVTNSIQAQKMRALEKQLGVKKQNVADKDIAEPVNKTKGKGSKEVESKAIPDVSDMDE